ncbi:alpha/beta fold hydrolase [Streptomyces sp. NPDC021622]|uniref:thioesterase II family protein n=1 Tax=Streptomyces sp. NPDC021622 TaxID=3155013 RepID=UPI0033FAFEF1
MSGRTTRLVCLHHAGGSPAVFGSWAQQAPEGVEVLPLALPGGANAGSRRRYHRTEQLIPALVTELQEHLADDDYVLFGHSMGGLLAYLLTRHFEEHGGRRPRALAVAALGAPQVPWHDFAAEHDDEALIRWLHGIGGIPSWLLDHPAWLVPFLGRVRDDVAVCRSYRHVPQERRLAVPIHVYGGAEDPLVSAQILERWTEIGERVEITSLPGRHFLVSEDSGQLSRAVFDLALGGRPLA